MNTVIVPVFALFSAFCLAPTAQAASCAGCGDGDPVHARGQAPGDSSSVQSSTVTTGSPPRGTSNPSSPAAESKIANSSPVPRTALPIGGEGDKNGIVCIGDNCIDANCVEDGPPSVVDRLTQ